MAALGEPLGGEADIESAFGERLLVSRTMFTHHQTGLSKLDKRGRSAYLLYLAETILRPDEAWLSQGAFGDETLTLLARFVRGRENFAGVAAFKASARAWEGWSAFQAEKSEYVERLRAGVLTHRRGT